VGRGLFAFVEQVTSELGAMIEEALPRAAPRPGAPAASPKALPAASPKALPAAQPLALPAGSATTQDLAAD
jgi:hypothetical protein